MGITVQQCETFQWTTDVTKLVPNRWSSSSALGSIGSPGPYGSGSYLRMLANGKLSTFAWAASGALFIEFSLRVASLTGTDLVVGHVNTASAAVSLGINAGGQLYINFPTAGGLTNYPANIAVGNWYRIQWTVLFGNPGRSVIKVNGNDITAGGRTGNFQYFGDYAPVTFFKLRYDNDPSSDWSNIIWGFITNPVTDFFPADQRAICLKPAANASVAFLPNGAAANWQCLTQVLEPDGDTTYNGSNVSGNQDLFTIPPPGLSGTINLVAATAIARKDDAAPVFLTPSIRTNVTTVQGASVGQGSSYQGITTPWLTNPVTAAPWTTGEIDLIQVGYRNAT